MHLSCSRYMCAGTQFAQTAANRAHPLRDRRATSNPLCTLSVTFTAYRVGHVGHTRRLPPPRQAPIVVAAYAGTALLAQKMEEAVRCHQDDDAAVEFGVAAARILERVVLGDSVASALLWARSSRR
jgi:hypothetical protein